MTHPHEDSSLLVPTQWQPSSILRSLSSAVGTAAQAPGLRQQLSASQDCAATLQAARLPSVVQIGDQSGHYKANVSTTAQQLCYATSDGYVSGAMHYVVVGDGAEGPLDAMATYFYRCAL